MVKLYVKDNTTGKIHEYGTSPHDSLVLKEDGSIHYLNLQTCTGTRFPSEGYSFCLEDGIDNCENETYNCDACVKNGDCIEQGIDGKPRWMEQQESRG